MDPNDDLELEEEGMPPRDELPWDLLDEEYDPDSDAEDAYWESVHADR